MPPEQQRRSRSVTMLHVSGAPAPNKTPEATRAFHDVVLGDPDLLAAEFDAIIAGAWDGAWPAWPRPRPGFTGPPRAPLRREGWAAPAPRAVELVRLPRRRPRGPP